MRGLFFADLTGSRFQVVLLARPYFRSAERLIRLHAVSEALRTLDALQLAVALELHRRGVVSELIASGKKLCRVAALEGLQAINPPSNKRSSRLRISPAALGKAMTPFAG